MLFKENKREPRHTWARRYTWLSEVFDLCISPQDDRKLLLGSGATALGRWFLVLAAREFVLCAVLQISVHVQIHKAMSSNSYKLSGSSDRTSQASGHSGHSEACA